MSIEGSKRAMRPLVLILMILGASACARIDYNPSVIQSEPGPIVAAPPGASDRLAPGQIRVERGDSLYSIARQNGVALRALIDANRLKAPYVIFPGQVLQLPGKNMHVVQDDETIYAISQRFGIDMGELVRINRIPPPYLIEKGQKLLLPEGQGAPVKTVARHAPPQVERTEDTRAAANPTSLPTPDARAAERPPAPRIAKAAPRPLQEPAKRSGGKFLWPVRGRVLVGFGPRQGGFHNDGINIAAPAGTPVHAAENGVVVYTGNQLQGFGNMVLIKHADGWMTAYAHNAQLMVSRGDIVRRGQIISRVGNSGNVVQSQLHFELRRGDQAVDPRRYLVRVAFLGPVRQFAAGH